MYVATFSELRIGDIDRAGGKNAGLGELQHALMGQDANVPDGFAITAHAFRTFIEAHNLGSFLKEALEGLDPSNIEDLQSRGARIRQRIREAGLPDDIVAAVKGALANLGDGPVAVRSSATAEDLPEASFAGQQETFLNVQGPDAVIDAVQRCYASLFTDRAISYRQGQGFDHLEVALSVGIQRMVQSASSGVMFTLDPDQGIREVVHIDAVRGLGEALVSGEATPDQYKVYAPLLDGHAPLLDRVAGYDGESFVITIEQALRLARVGKAIEAHFGRPMDIEWAYDPDGSLQILQARPETVQARKGPPGLSRTILESHGDRLVTGIAVGADVGSGRVRVMTDVSQLSSFKEGEVLVAVRTDPDWEPAMRKAAAIVTDTGGRTCHAAIVCRELGVPAVVGAGDATAVLTSGTEVTVSCAEGYEGHIYEGRGSWRYEEVEVEAGKEIPTKIMVNVANPFDAWRAAMLPVDGVGLLRLEFLVGSHIGIHPRALLDPTQTSEDARARIAKVTKPYGSGSAYFVDRLATGVGQVAAAFHPRPVIVRMSDFKTNEYRGLLGGDVFEQLEANPMIGWRGASRYVDPDFRNAFQLECQALARVRGEMGLDNVRVMVPFCRTLGEADRVIATMAEFGLVRGENDLKIYVMVEIPANAVLAHEFAERFDGFSIGSNDLTQLTLGIDRDGDRIQASFDEADPAVKALIARAIEGGHAKGIPVGICGQAPSDKPDFAAWLVEQGIDSISLTPDSVMRTRKRLASL
ncbi:MAG: phosphoenolpyruvate synthase [Myxococcota bacterium]